jgi:hypothetical protein
MALCPTIKKVWNKMPSCPTLFLAFSQLFHQREDQGDERNQDDGEKTENDGQ